jgi:hypothetical protein
MRFSILHFNCCSSALVSYAGTFVMHLVENLL